MTRFTIRGHDLLVVERFRDDTRYMVEFEVLEDDNLIALRGETARLFLSEQGYQKVLHSQELGKIHMLPFRSLSISTLEGRKGVYVLITKDEDRAQSLRLRKPSVRKKLSETKAEPGHTDKKKVREQER